MRRLLSCLLLGAMVWVDLAWAGAPDVLRARRAAEHALGLSSTPLANGPVRVATKRRRRLTAAQQAVVKELRSRKNRATVQWWIRKHQPTWTLGSSGAWQQAGFGGLVQRAIWEFKTWPKAARVARLPKATGKRGPKGPWRWSRSAILTALRSPNNRAKVRAWIQAKHPDWSLGSSGAWQQAGFGGLVERASEAFQTWPQAARVARLPTPTGRRGTISQWSTRQGILEALRDPANQQTVQRWIAKHHLGWSLSSSYAWTKAGFGYTVRLAKREFGSWPAALKEVQVPELVPIARAFPSKATKKAILEALRDETNQQRVRAWIATHQPGWTLGSSRAWQQAGFGGLVQRAQKTLGWRRVARAAKLPETGSPWSTKRAIVQALRNRTNRAQVRAWIATHQPGWTLGSSEAWHQAGFGGLVGRASKAFDGWPKAARVAKLPKATGRRGPLPKAQPLESTQALNGTRLLATSL